MSRNAEGFAVNQLPVPHVSENHLEITGDSQRLHIRNAAPWIHAMENE
jgi:hypothetical protein